MRRPFEGLEPVRLARLPAVAASLLAHALLLVLLLALPRARYEEPVRFIFLAPQDSAAREVALPPLVPSGAPPPAVAPAGAIRVATGGLPATAPGESAPRPLPGPGRDTGAVEGLAVGVGRDTAPTAPTPRLGDASLWVRPFTLAELPPDVREAILGSPSARERIQAIFDSVEAEPGAQRRLPSWAVDLPGVGPVGVDSASIRVGPLTIPAAVLALIPFPQGNIEEAERAERLAEMRADLMRAAQRAETVEEFKKAVKALRERKQRERDEERARKAARDTIKP